MSPPRPPNNRPPGLIDHGVERTVRKWAIEEVRREIAGIEMRRMEPRIMSPETQDEAPLLILQSHSTSPAPLQNRVAINVAGAFPADVIVQVVHGYMLDIVVHGVTGYTGTAGILTAVPFEWDGFEIIRTHLFHNLANTHMTYPGSAATLHNVTPGLHTLRVEAVVNGTSDANDFANVSIYDYKAPMGD